MGDYYFKKHSSSNDMYSNFLIQVLGFDKVDSERKVIVTSSDNSSIKYNDYLLNGWNIEIINKLSYEKDNFVKKNLDDEKENLTFKPKLLKVRKMVVLD